MAEDKKLDTVKKALVVIAKNRDIPITTKNGPKPVLILLNTVLTVVFGE